MSGDDDELDPEIEEFKRKRRRGIALRFGAAGLLTAIAGAVVFGYGRHLNAEQEGSMVRYALPDQLELAGIGALIVGAILLAAAGVVAFLAIRDARRVRVPRAEIRKH